MLLPHSPSRRADVFFYGLFMDPELLREQGLAPEGVELAFVEGLALRIGRRAALVPQLSGRVHGVVMTLTLDELDRLYADPSVQAYRPEAVLVHLRGDEVLPALCYNLPDAPSSDERNPEYITRLREVARKVGLPDAYVESIG